MNTTVAELVAPSTWEALRALADGPPPVLVVLETPLAGLGVLAAESVADGWVDAAARPLDLRVVRPRSDRWSVGEVDELVVAPTRTIPVERHVVVVDDASSMEVAAAEHLLKTVEEPSAPASFVFCVPDASTLLPTIRGRATRVLRISPAPASARRDALVRAGAPLERAAEAVARAGNQVALAPLLVSDEALLRAAAVLDGPLEPSQPLASAIAAAQALESLAQALAHPQGGKADAATRATTRVLVRELLERRRRLVSVELRTLPARERHHQLRAHLRRADDAVDQLRGYAGVPLVLAALLAPL